MTKKATTKIKNAFVFSAGKGLRFYPYSSKQPKALFRINGEALIVRNIKQIDSAFPFLEKITVLVGYMGENIQTELSSLKLNNKLEFVKVKNDYVDAGLIGGFATISSMVQRDELILCALADEFYGENDHVRFSEFLRENEIGSACFGIKRMENPEEYLKNYAVYLEGVNNVKKVVEKPTRIESEYFGLGIFATRGYLCHIAENKIVNGGGPLINLCNLMPTAGYGPLSGFEFNDIYVNINTPFDAYNCLRQVRKKIQPTIDVVVPAWNESESIEFVVKDFLPYCRSVIVMDNLSKDGTAEIARDAGAIVYSDNYKGYGDAIKKGLDSSDADILVIVEADGTFRAKDLPKILVYMFDADAVIGSRTHWQYIEYAANMNFIQRMINILYGSIITLLWWNRHSRFTDVGCSYRAIWRESYKKISTKIKENGPAFAPEFVILLLENWSRVIEVPVPYHARIFGISKFSGSLIGLAKTALKMMRLILQQRIIGWWRVLTFSKL